MKLVSFLTAMCDMESAGLARTWSLHALTSVVLRRVSRAKGSDETLLLHARPLLLLLLPLLLLLLQLLQDRFRLLGGSTSTAMGAFTYRCWLSMPNI